MSIHLHGLRTVIHPVRDLDADKRWWAALLGFGPYFDQPFYVGFEVAGYELGLLPQGADGKPAGPITYWGVADADAALAHLLAAGAELDGPVTDVGDGIRTASVVEPGGSIFGIIENPHFHLPA